MTRINNRGMSGVGLCLKPGVDRLWEGVMKVFPARPEGVTDRFLSLCL